MKDKVFEILEEVERFNSSDPDIVESFRIKYLGRNGIIKSLYQEFKAVPVDQKKEVGQLLNNLKTLALSKTTVQGRGAPSKGSAPLFDWTRPVQKFFTGSRHPISIVRNEIVDIFKKIGFGLSEGPEIEDDWHNFTALNFPKEHPARDMQDTFFIDQEMALRTHTSSVQVRVMESETPPIRTISPGRVFRNEAISARSHCIFHQVEGLYIDRGVSFADMKQTLLYFAREFFGADSKIRLRPSFFPFTEPSAEVDVYWGLESETDYRITKGTGWLEIMGCGMVDPNVLENCKIDPNDFSGFAFGMGIERIAMLKYQINDIRHFFENDIRFIEQFNSSI